MLRNSFDRLKKEKPASKIVYLSKVNPARKIANWFYRRFHCSRGLSHGLLSDDAELIMLTQNSETESEYLNFTLESHSGETRIKSAWLR
jgi:hypothetical protein